ncbi:hypothetical protein BaRGS_00016046, partial [Batillaria attramentaria]
MTSFTTEDDWISSDVITTTTGSLSSEGSRSNQEADGIHFQDFFNATLGFLILSANGSTFAIVVKSSALKLKTK